MLFSGLSPIAPGTAGTAVTAAAYLALCGCLNPWAWVALLTVVTAAAVPLAGAEARARGRPDPGPVVIDEAAGFLFTVAFLPCGAWTALAAFLVFRALDILKPPPVRQLERLPGGWGIVLDDVAAGILGNLLLRAGGALVTG